MVDGLFVRKGTLPRPQAYVLEKISYSVAFVKVKTSWVWRAAVKRGTASGPPIFRFLNLERPSGNVASASAVTDRRYNLPLLRKRVRAGINGVRINQLFDAQGLALKMTADNNDLHIFFNR